MLDPIATTLVIVVISIDGRGLSYCSPQGCKRMFSSESDFLHSAMLHSVPLTLFTTPPPPPLENNSGSLKPPTFPLLRSTTPKDYSRYSLSTFVSTPTSNTEHPLGTEVGTHTNLTEHFFLQ